MEPAGFSLCVDAVPLPLVCYKPDSEQVVDANRLFTKLINVPVERIKGRPFRQVLFDWPNCKGSRPGVQRSHKAVPKRSEFIRERNGSSDELVFVSEVTECLSPSGARFYAKLSANFSNPRLVVLAINDVTQDRDKETEEQKDFKRRLEQFPAMLYTFVRLPNGKQKFTYASASSWRVWNVPPEAVTAENGAERLIAAIVDQKAFADSVEVSARTLKTWNWTGKCRIQDIEDKSKFHTRWLRGISEPRKLEDGTIKWNGGVFDITKEMLQKEQIEQAQRNIEMEHERAEVAQEFSELLSHEVRNPLSGIDSCTKLISQTLENLLGHINRRSVPKHVDGDAVNVGVDPSRKSRDPVLQKELNVMKEDINQITRCTEYIKNILENTLDLAKMRSQKLELNLATVDLQEDVLGPTIQMFRKSSRAVDVYLVCKGCINVRCDPFRLKQILVNLINNGIKHTSTGYVRVVATRVNARMIQVAVEDSGMGIPPNKREKVFNKYEKAGSTMNQTGHGIGLSLCQGLVQKMNGTIRVDPDYKSSINGKGARIEMNLPFAQVQLSETVGERKEEQVELPRNVRVLICDDSKMGLALTKRRLAAHTQGWSFDECYSGEEAVEAAKRFAYGLILIDEHLHDGGGKLRGHEAMRLIRDDLGKTTPIIGCSANELSKLHLNSGASIIWRKPLPDDAAMLNDLSRVFQSSYVTNSVPQIDHKRRKLV